MAEKVFISHSKFDKSIAEMICNSLEAEGINCWIAPRDIPYGNDWAGEISSAIENSSLFIFILSEHSNASRQCPKEITVADNVGIPIVCVKIDDVEMSQGLKYHLSTQQILFLDASNIKEELKIVTSAISDKLSDKTNNGGNYTYNIDQQLEERFDELFAPSAKDTKSSIEKKLDDILSRNFMRALLEGVDDKNSNSEKTEENQPTMEKQLLLSPSKQEDEFIRGKHFSLPQMDGVKTIVFQVIDNTIDYATMSEYYNCVLLDSIEDDHLTTFFPHKPPKIGSRIVILHFDSREHRVFVNTGILYVDKLTMSKNPVVTSFQRVSVENNVLSLNEVSYESESAAFEQANNDKTKAKWVDADVKASPIILIDPETAEPVRRKVYYDSDQKCMKAKMLVVPNKSYFAFQIRQTESNATSFPLSCLQQGIYYRKGVHGFPKDPMKAAQLLEDESSGEALCELALLFKEKGDFYDPNTYEDYLLRSVSMGCEKAVVEVSLSVAFGECSFKTIDECIELLKQTVTDSSGVGNFALAYLLENDYPELAFSLYMKAAQNEYAPAISRLQCSDYTLDGQIEADLYNAFMTSHKENKGLLEYCMGCVCFYGLDIEARTEIGLDLIKNSAYLGDIDSQKLLFDIFDSDEKFTDKTKALFWLEKIAKHDTYFLVILANWYLDGIGCDCSTVGDEKAFALLSTLELSDDYTAINNLAWLYKTGRGCEQDYKKAKELFERSAEMGSASSYYNLGTIYEKGLGVDINLDTAKKMYEIASEKGNQKAKERLVYLQS